MDIYSLKPINFYDTKTHIFIDSLSPSVFLSPPTLSISSVAKTPSSYVIDTYHDFSAGQNLLDILIFDYNEDRMNNMLYTWNKNVNYILIKK